MMTDEAKRLRLLEQLAISRAAKKPKIPVMPPSAEASSQGKQTSSAIPEGDDPSHNVIMVDSETERRGPIDIAVVDSAAAVAAQRKELKGSSKADDAGKGNPKKRKAPSESAAQTRPAESKIWMNVPLRDVGSCVEDLSMKEWEDEAQLLQVWIARSLTMTDVIGHLKTSLAGARSALKEKEVELASVEKSKAEAIAAKDAVITEKNQSLTKVQSDYDAAITRNIELASRVKLLEESCSSFEAERQAWAEEKKKLGKEKQDAEGLTAHYQELFMKEAEATYVNVLEQVQFFNPAAKLNNVHYLHFVKDGVLMRNNPETFEPEPAPLVDEADAMPAPVVVCPDASDARKTNSEGDPQSIQTI